MLGPSSRVSEILDNPDTDDRTKELACIAYTETLSRRREYYKTLQGLRGSERNERNRERYSKQSAILRPLKLKKKQARVARNHLYVLNYLRGRFCLDCGESNPLLLDFDHVAPDKHHSIADLVANAASLATLQLEIDKCEVVCSNCHRRRTCRRSNSYRVRRANNEDDAQSYRDVADVFRKSWLKRRARNQAVVFEYLSSHPCVDCKERDPIVLEFDHIRGHKQDDIASIVAVGGSIERLQLEIDKCEVVCSNCHRSRTAETRQYFRLRHAS